MKIDDTNKAIFRSLLDGRKSFSQVSEELGIAENTVRTRVSKLTSDGTMSITGLVNPEHVPGMQVVIMGVKLKTMDLDTKAKEFCTLRGVISVAVVTGRYDLMVNVLLDEGEGLTLLEFFKNEVVKVKDVQAVETFVVYQSHNFLVPYII